MLENQPWKNNSYELLVVRIHIYSIQAGIYISKLARKTLEEGLNYVQS